MSIFSSKKFRRSSSSIEFLWRNSRCPSEFRQHFFYVSTGIFFNKKYIKYTLSFYFLYFFLIRLFYNFSFNDDKKYVLFFMLIYLVDLETVGPVKSPVKLKVVWLFFYSHGVSSRGFIMYRRIAIMTSLYKLYSPVSSWNGILFN